MKLFIQEETLNEIGNAIREKTETGDLIAPGDMPAMIRGIESGGADPVIQELEISSNGTYNTYEGVDGFAPIRVNVPQDGAPTPAELTFSGDCSYRFSNSGWDWFIKKYGHQMTLENINGCSKMFYQCQYGGEWPFEISLSPSHTYGIDMEAMFQFTGLTMNTLPKINGAVVRNMQDFISYSYVWRVPDDYFDSFDWSAIEKETGQYGAKIGCMTSQAYCLRSFPWHIYNHENPYIANSNYCYYSGFCYMYLLDEAVNLPIPYTVDWTSNNMGYQGFTECRRIKDFTFAVDENGQPLVKRWKSQVMEMHKNFGWGMNSSQSYFDISDDKKVFDDESYQALKNDPDWFTNDVAYSRYNHDSAVRTINSLPDTSAFGTNTIKFKGEAGSKTDGGAINTLTDAEIAVAAAKGWTVTFA